MGTYRSWADMAGILAENSNGSGSLGALAFSASFSTAAPSLSAFLATKKLVLARKETKTRALAVLGLTHICHFSGLLPIWLGNRRDKDRLDSKSRI